jgi:hypothetical protein
MVVCVLLCKGMLNKHCNRTMLPTYLPSCAIWDALCVVVLTAMQTCNECTVSAWK